MRYTSHGMIYIYMPGFMNIGSGIQIILKLLPRQLQRLLFSYYVCDMTSGGMMYIPCFIKIASGIQKLIGEDTYTDTDTDTWAGR
jgi:hypothetical protein